MGDDRGEFLRLTRMMGDLVAELERLATPPAEHRPGVHTFQPDAGADQLLQQIAEARNAREPDAFEAYGHRPNVLRDAFCVGLARLAELEGLEVPPAVGEFATAARGIPDRSISPRAAVLLQAAAVLFGGDWEAGMGEASAGERIRRSASIARRLLAEIEAGADDVSGQ